MAQTNVQAFSGDVETIGKSYGFKLNTQLVEADKSSTDWYRLLKTGFRQGTDAFRTRCELLIVAAGLHETVTFDVNYQVALAYAEGSILNVYGHDTFLDRNAVVKFRLVETADGTFLDVQFNASVVDLDRVWTVNLYVEGGTQAVAPTTFLQRITNYTGITDSRIYNIGSAAFLVQPSSNTAPFAITSSGKVGIGTTSPKQMFEVDSSGYGLFSGRLGVGNVLTSAQNGGFDDIWNIGTSAKLVVRVANSVNPTATYANARAYAGIALVPGFDGGDTTNIGLWGQNSGENPTFYIQNQVNNGANGGGSIALQPVAGNVGIGTTEPVGPLDILKPATASRLMRLGVTSGATGMNFYCGTGGSNNTWTYTGIPFALYNSGGGTILFLFNMNTGGDDQTSSQVWIIRKPYSTTFVQDSTNAYMITHLNGGGGGTMSFRQNNNLLEYRNSGAGNAHFYAIECD